MYFNQELKDSKRSCHVTDEVMSLFLSLKNYQVENYFHANFHCRVMKRRLSTALGLAYRLFRSCLFHLKFLISQ